MSAPRRERRPKVSTYSAPSFVFTDAQWKALESISSLSAMKPRITSAPSVHRAGGAGTPASLRARQCDATVEVFPPASPGPFHDLLQKLEPGVGAQKVHQSVGARFSPTFEPQLGGALRDLGTAGKVDGGFRRPQAASHVTDGVNTPNPTPVLAESRLCEKGGLCRHQATSEGDAKCSTPPPTSTAIRL